MFIINKKRVIFLFSAVFLPIGIFMFQMSNNSIKKQTIETMSMPVTSKTIVLDAGHGGEDGGAVSSNGISESNINLKIVLKLQNLLEQSGCNVILTRSDENAIYDLDSPTQ